MEHRRPSSTTSEESHHIHHEEPDHQVDIKRVKILVVEPRWFELRVKERPSLHKDGERYNILTIWNNVLNSRVQVPGPRTLDNTNLPPLSS